MKVARREKSIINKYGSVILFYEVDNNSLWLAHIEDAYPQSGDCFHMTWPAIEQAMLDTYGSQMSQSHFFALFDHCDFCVNDNILVLYNEKNKSEYFTYKIC